MSCIEEISCDMVGHQNQVSRLEKNFAHLGILFQLGPHGPNHQTVVLRPRLRTVLHSLALKGHPVDSHLPHVRLACIPGVLGFKRGHLRDFRARMRPRNPRRFRASIVGTLRIEHHLPESFHAQVALASKRKGCRREVGQDSKFVALRENHFARLGRLRKYLPPRLLVFWNRRPPVRRIRISILRVRRGPDNDQEQREALTPLR